MKIQIDINKEIPKEKYKDIISAVQEAVSEHIDQE